MRDLPRLGFGLPVSGSWATPATMLHVARRAEALGYAGLWTFQRVLRPAEGSLPPGSARLDPPSRPADDPAYWAVHDPLAPLAYVAGHTERIALGTATICAPLVAPALLAKAAATLDVLSAGRLVLGLGLGWLPHEYAAAGIPFSRRGARMEEYLRCLHALWTSDPVEFAGEFYTVPRSHCRVHPVQRPHPPVLLGGTAPPALRRAGRLASGWIASTQQDPARLAPAVELVRAGARGAGKDEDGVRILARVVVELHDDERSRPRPPFTGTREQVLDDLARLRGQGATDALVDLNFSPRVGSPHVDAAAALAYAEQVLDALAPAAAGREVSRPRPSA